MKKCIVFLALLMMILIAVGAPSIASALASDQGLSVRDTVTTEGVLQPVLVAANVSDELVAQMAEPADTEATDFTLAEPSIWDVLPPANIGVIYAKAFDGAESGAALKFGITVWQDELFGKPVDAEIDVLGFIDTADLGAGLSANIRDVIGAINIGAGYLPKNYGWSWWIGTTVKQF